MRHVLLPPEEREKLVNKLYRWNEWAARYLRPFHEHIRDMRKVWNGKPDSPTRSTPWLGAPNFAIPVAQIEVNSLSSKQISALFQTDPLWTMQGLTQNQTGIEELREARETFLNYVGKEREHMDLYRVYASDESGIIHTMNGDGMAVLKCPWVARSENIINPNTGKLGKFKRSAGPKPYMVPIENMLFHPTLMKDENDTDIIGEIIPMTRERLEERARDGVYDAEAVKKVLATPDRTSPTSGQRDEQSNAHVNVSTEQEFTSEYLPVEFYIRWYVQGAKSAKQDEITGKIQTPDEAEKVDTGTYHLIVTFHPKTREVLRCVFNFYPENLTPYIFWYYARKRGTAVGEGIPERLEEVQRMMSELKNTRRANGMIANTRMFVVKPNLAAQSRVVMPNGVWVTPNPGADAIALPMGDVNPSSFEEEDSDWGLVERITGNPEAQNGSGAGSISKTKGIYTALPALGAMQMGNTRGDIKVCDSHYFHKRLGQMAFKMYSHFGIDDDLLKRFGDLGAVIQKSIDQENMNLLLIPTHATTASNNQEVDRQNTQLIASQISQFNQRRAQMLDAAAAGPLPVAKDTWECLRGEILVMRQLTKAFNHDDSNRLIADLPSNGDFNSFRASAQPPPPPPGPPGGAAPGAPGGAQGAGPGMPGGPGAPGGSGGPPTPGQHPPAQLPARTH